MDELEMGRRSKKGDWTPHEALTLPPFWRGAFGPRDLGRFALDYVWPWNAFHMTTALLYWWLVVPDVETMRTLSWGWALWLYAVNATCIFLFYGFFELRFYVLRRQERRFKYNGRFPSEQPSDVFWFQSQNIDNVLRSFLVTIPIWTAVEVLMLWGFAKGFASWLPWADHWLWLSALVLLAPAIHEVHFFAIHRLIHWGPLYRWIHSVHHNSVNPSPWSSLSMHPVEGLLYHAVALWHLVIPSNPIVALFQLHGAGFGAVNGHLGFHRLELTPELMLDGHAYAHYLHHKHFEVNYGGDGVIPLDRWFGTWHDGSKEGEARMDARYRAKVARVNARRKAARAPAG